MCGHLHRSARESKTSNYILNAIAKSDQSDFPAHLDHWLGFMRSVFDSMPSANLCASSSDKPLTTLATRATPRPRALKSVCIEVSWWAFEYAYMAALADTFHLNYLQLI